MSRELKNVKVTHVSFVDKAANKKKFFLTKSDGAPQTFETTVRTITKADDPQKLVYGVVYEPDVKDAHDDFMTAEEIEKAAHGFMQNYQQIDKQHDFEAGAGTVVQSYIAPCDLELGETIQKGSWVLVTKATDEIWESIQKGEFTGYSLAGNAEVTEVKKATQGIFNKNKLIRDVSTAIDAFHSATWRIRDDYQLDDASKIQEIQSEITELSNLIGGFTITKSQEEKGLINTIKSFFNTQKQEDEEMKIEDITKAVTAAMEPVNERLTALEKANTGDGKEKTAEELAVEKKKKEEADASDALTKAVEDATKPLLDRIEKMENVRKSNVAEPSYTASEDVEKSEVPNYVNEVYSLDD